MSLTPSEREELDAGIASGFWAIFSKHVTEEWGPSGLRYQQAVRNAAASHEAVVELQKVIATQEAVLTLMRWPAERLAQLTRNAPKPDGYQSRRGGL